MIRPFRFVLPGDRGHVLVALAVAAVTAAVFWPTVHGGFLDWDDAVNFVRNRGFRGLGPAQLHWMFTSVLLGHYIPLTWLTFGFNYVLGGMDPWGYHAVNVVLHAINAGLLALIARRLLDAAARGRLGEPALLGGAGFAALVFAIHPLRAESVAWVTERRDLLSGMFYLLSVLVYIRSVAADRIIGGARLAVSVALFGAGLLSKSIVMTLPATLLLLDVYPLRRTALGCRALLREKVPYVVLATAGAVIALLAVRRGAVFTGYGQYGPEARIALTAHSLWFYPAKMLWPVGLSPLYELPVRVSLWDPQFLVPVVAVAGLSVILAALARRWPAGAAAWIQSAIVLMPVAGLVHAGHQLAHDRYSYLSGLGLSLLAGVAVAWVLQRRPGAAGISAAGIIGVAVLGTLATLTSWQIGIWRDPESLWRGAIKAEPTCSRCYANLGRFLVDRDLASDAEPYLRKAIALRPERIALHEDLANALRRQGRLLEAEAWVRQSLAVDPRSANGRNVLGKILFDLGRHDEAEAAFREVTRAAPEWGDAHANLGSLLLRRGQYAEAVVHLRRARELSPELPKVDAALAAALQGLRADDPARRP